MTSRRSRSSRSARSWAIGVLGVTAALLAASPASAQRGPGAGGRGRRPPPSKSEPSGGGASSDDEDERPSMLRTEPVMAPPANPLEMSPEVRARVGSDWQLGPPPPEGPLRHTRIFPYYEARRGDFRLRLLPPFFMEQSRGLPDPSQAEYGVPKTEDTEGLYGLFFYRRRSLHLDMDVLFPAFWRVRDGDSHLWVVGPFVHREAPSQNDNWLAPLYFQGSRPDGGYFHMPLLLTTSHWNKGGAFTLVGPYFRTRTGSDVDLGVAPFFFHGDNGDLEGNRRRYTLIPPLLFYHAEHELDASRTTVAGPVIVQSDPKRDVVDFAPLFFHIQGKPLSGGVAESHTTLLPFFHYGYDPQGSLLVLPGLYRRVTPDSYTLLSLFYSHSSTRSGATTLDAAGPVLPLYWDFRDRDLGVHAWAAAPFYYTSDSPSGHDWLTPLIGHFQTYGESSTWWALPTFFIKTDTHGWEGDLLPIAFFGRSESSSHTVIAPVFWDFASPKGRTTIGAPLFFRFADGQDDSVTQIAANTLYMQKRVAGGLDWQFHLLPLFSYGENPSGYFWNVLFGLAGYSRSGAHSEVRALWIPIGFGGASAASETKSAAGMAVVPGAAREDR